MSTPTTAADIDHYIVTAINRLRAAVGVETVAYVNIGCYQWGSDAREGKMTVTHTLHYGSGSAELKVEGADLNQLVDKMILMLQARGDIEPAREYVRALAAPTSPRVEDAEFSDITLETLGNNVPF